MTLLEFVFSNKEKRLHVRSTIVPPENLHDVKCPHPFIF